MSLLNNSNAIPTAVGGGYNLEDSLRFRSATSAYLNRTASAAPTDGKKVTLSCWVKRGITGSRVYMLQTGAGAGNDNYSGFYFNSNNTIQVSMYSVTPRVTTQVFRDPSAWYHFVLAYDTTQGAADDRCKLYVNGEQVTSFTTNGAIPLNTLIAFTKQSQANYIGTASDEATYFDGYMTEINLIDGQQLTPTDFGEYNEDTGGWQPIEYTGTYGNNGYYLKGRGTDNSGNGNNWTENNFNTTNSALTTYDIMTDVPTLTDEDTANYAVMNPLDLASTSTVISNGNLKVSHTGTVWNAARANMGVSSGKWYWEVTVSVVGFTFAGGVMKTELTILDNTYPGHTAYPSGSSFSYYFQGTKWGVVNNAAYGASYTNGDTIGTALDLDAGTITFYKNGVSQGVAFTGLSGEFAPATGLYSTSNHLVNFGQQPFRYTPPTGHLKLNTFNLPDSSIVDGSEYFNTATYTGNGTGQSITGVGFQPDLVWIKSRSDVDNNVLQDAVRGVTRQLFSNLTNAETNFTNGVTSFNADGFTVATSNWSNENGQTRVAWNWKAGGTAVSNTDGTITSQVSANPTAGFSVVTYTGNATAGATVGHGLSSAPKMMIVKNRDTANPWLVYHQDVATDPATDYLVLNTTAAKVDNVVIWNDTAPTASVFSLGSSTSTNGNGNNMVAYCFAEVEGYSKFGIYTGNGSANGPFVYTGFRPAFVMMKATTAVSGNWAIYDVKRNVYNISENLLFANLSQAEAVAQSKIDILSNGFKCRSTNSNSNTNNASYIYMAFAENPFKNSLAR